MSESLPHPATVDVERLLSDCDVTRQRRSGPGGQHRNRVATAVRLTHRPTGLTAEASERRSQSENLSAAVRRLRTSLAIEVRCSADTAPSRVWQQRCQRGILRVNPDHADYPSLLAEALDVLDGEQWNIPAAADRLGCSATQLVKLLRQEHRALTLLNEHRRAAGLAPLR